MFRVNLPTRSPDTPVLRSDNYRTLDNYWTEGLAYQIDETQAQTLRTAAHDILDRFSEAMDYVTGNSTVFEKFAFDENKNDDRAIRRLIKASWKDVSSRRYILDRWDMGWDGVNPPKLLERNFGHMGLCIATGPVTEEYISWLQKQEGHEDVRPFGSLRENVIRAFREVADECGVFSGSHVALVGHPNIANYDTEMIQAARVLRKWISRAGLIPDLIEAQSCYLEDGRTYIDRYLTNNEQTYQHNREASDRLASSRFLLQGVRYTYWTNAPAIYAFCGFDGYARNVAARSTPKHPIPDQRTKTLEPFWTLLATHKGMLAVLHELFPNHPNFLPAFWGDEALTGEKRIIKHVLGYQGLESTIWDNGKILLKRNNRKEIVHKLPVSKSWITQAYCDAVIDPDDGFRVFNLFTTNGEPAALGARRAPGPFVGGEDTKTCFSAVVIRTKKDSSCAPAGVA